MDIKAYVPGLAVVLGIASVSSYISTLHPSFDGLVISIIIGMVFGNLIGEKKFFSEGNEAGLKIFLPLGIAFYGTKLVFKELDVQLFLALISIFAGLFIGTLLVSKILNIDRKTSILLSSGLSVCGASAIAIISPLIGARREETSISVISVMMLGLTGMITYPLLYDALSLTTEQYSLLAGTTLPMLGQVKVASKAVCQECFVTAVKLKLIRISFLVFLISLAIFLSGRSERKIKIPWFIIVFIVFAVLANTTKLLLPVQQYFNFSSKFFLTAALAAIGFSADFDAIIEKGITPLVTIFLSWGMITMLIYFVVSLC
jgi:uncharacterized integral membrane protein (TIGR00698 family)